MTINPQFAGWPLVSESPEAAKEQRYADELYALQAENAHFRDDAVWLRDTLGYTPFTAPEDTWDTEITPLTVENKEGEFEQSFLENPYFPLLQTHLNSSTNENHGISQEQMENIADLFTLHHDMISAVRDTLWPNHEVLSQITQLDNPEMENTRRQEMYRDLWVPKTSQVDMHWQWGDTLTNLISENYIRITDTNGEIDLHASLVLSIQTSTNRIVDGKRTFERTEAFQDAYERIMNAEGTEASLWDDLLTIYHAVNVFEGRWGRKQTEAYQKTQLRAVEWARQNEAFHTAQLQTITQDIPWQEQETEEILPDETDIEGWDVFTAGTLDAWWEQGETVQKTA